MINSQKFPKFVKLVEVGPRDGLQNEKKIIPLDVKVQLIDKLSNAGFLNIESASYVSPKWVPQMATSKEVMQRIIRKKGVVYSALVPNMKGLEFALENKIDEIVIFSAASESFSKKNINCSISESINRFQKVVEVAKENNIRVRGSISCSFGCPYEGEIKPQSTTDVVSRLKDLGCDEIDIADTIGVATADKIKIVFLKISEIFPQENLSGHFHDTYGQALVNIYSALEVGIKIFHSSVAGLGGCPFAKGATGNVATEDVLYLLNGLGINTGISFDKVIDAGQFISDFLGKKSVSKVGAAFVSKKIEKGIS